MIAATVPTCNTVWNVTWRITRILLSIRKPYFILKLEIWNLLKSLFSSCRGTCLSPKRQCFSQPKLPAGEIVNTLFYALLNKPPDREVLISNTSVVLIYDGMNRRRISFLAQNFTDAIVTSTAAPQQSDVSTLPGIRKLPTNWPLIWHGFTTLFIYSVRFSSNKRVSRRVTPKNAGKGAFGAGSVAEENEHTDGPNTKNNTHSLAYMQIWKSAWN